MLKKITEPQAYYQKQGMPAMPANIMPSAAPLPFNKLPQKKGGGMKVVGGIIGLALILAVGVGGIMVAQKQKELGNTAVAPTAPESKPAAAGNPSDPKSSCRFCSGVCGDFAPDARCTRISDPAGYSCIENPTSQQPKCISVPTAACSISFNVAESGVASCVSKTAQLIISTGFKPLASGDSVPAKSTLRYTVEVSSTDSTTGQVTLTDTLDDNLTFLSSDPSADGTAVASGKIVTITFPAFTAAGTKKAIYQVKVVDAVQPITFTNSVKVTNNGSGAAGSQVAACSISLKTAAAGSAVCKEKTAYMIDASNAEVAIADEAALEPGTIFYYKVRVQAQSTTAQAVNFFDTLPKGIEYLDQVTPVSVINIQKEVNSKGQTLLSGTLGVIGAQATPNVPEDVYVTYKVKLADAAIPGKYTNSATIGNGTVEAPACNTHTVVVPPNGVAICESKEMHSAPISDKKPIAETKIPEGSKLDEGREFYYRLNIKAASTVAGKVAIKDMLPNNLELVSAGDFVNTSGVLTASLDAAFTGNKVLEFKVRVKSGIAGAAVANVAEVTTYKGTTSTVVGDTYNCSSGFEVAKYACDSSCTSDSQCKTASNDFTCDATSQKCRLTSNTESTTCQPKPEQFACNSSCSTTDQCKTVNTDYICTDTSDGKRCRRESNKSADNCQVVSTPGPTAVPQVTVTTPTVTTVGCNAVCATNADCSNSSHICYSGVCRLETNVDSATCAQAVAEAQPTLPEELPQTGPEDWINWLKAGLVTLGIGAVLLLLL